MKFLKWLLFPIAWLYGSIMQVRNSFYKNGIFKSTSFKIPVISVGNLTVGGTGKTPHVEFLLHLLQNKKLATLSRGYKRNTTGFVLADKTASAATVGDEPYQYFLDFPEVTVSVCEKRVTGIEKILELKPATEIIILDDAYQHRAVKPTLNLLITDFYRRFDTDFMMPTGLLREPRSGAERASAVIVSKCPETLSEDEQEKVHASISRYTFPGTPVFFTTYYYGKTVGFGSEKVSSKKIILVTAIANTTPLQEYLAGAGYQVLAHLKYPDHYAYNLSDLQELTKAWQPFKDQNLSIITTRKDAVKLLAPAFANIIKQLPIFYLPIQVAFLAGQEEFETLVLEAITANVP